MNKAFDIADLVDDLEPVHALNPRRPMLIALAVTLGLFIFVGLTSGLRKDLLSGHPESIFLLRSGILLLLGVGTAHAVLEMASPAVGKPQSSWQLALAAALLFPLAALIVALTGNSENVMAEMNSVGQCLAFSIFGALATAVPMVVHLRHGAPTSHSRAGWLVGLASGGLGALAYNLHCPFDDVVYIGTWYTLSVGTSAVIGRIFVPRLIRW
ncbi:MAG: DUF1109 domain-containing protein [Sphingorhabdus sp.]